MIDEDHLEKYVLGDLSLRDEILSIYTEQALSIAAKLDVTQTDEGWRNAVHKLKGAARGVGSWKLGDLCEEAEGMIGQMPGKFEMRATILVAIRAKVEDSIEDAERLRDAAAA